MQYGSASPTLPVSCWGGQEPKLFSSQSWMSQQAQSSAEGLEDSWRAPGLQ